jgi:hypothetical protein
MCKLVLANSLVFYYSMVLFVNNDSMIVIHRWYNASMTTKDAQILKGKLQGKTSKQIAAVVYPGSKNGDVTVRKHLQKATVKDALDKALKKHNITIDRILKPIDEALDAKNDIYSKDGTYIDSQPNHGVRLAASDRASKLMGLDKVHDTPQDTSPQPVIDHAAIHKAIEAGDMVTLQQIIFNQRS